MSKKAKELCSNVPEELREQAETLADAVFALQNKIKQQTPIYKNADLAQKVTVGTGETMLRQNPMAQEFRTLVKDYSQVLKDLQNILAVDEAEPARISDFDSFDKEFDIAT